MFKLNLSRVLVIMDYTVFGSAVLDQYKIRIMYLTERATSLVLMPLVVI